MRARWSLLAHRSVSLVPAVTASSSILAPALDESMATIWVRLLHGATTLVLVEVATDAYSAFSNMSNVLASSTRPAKPNIRCRHGLAQGGGMGREYLGSGFLRDTDAPSFVPTNINKGHISWGEFILPRPSLKFPALYHIILRSRHRRPARPVDATSSVLTQINGEHSRASTNCLDSLFFLVLLCPHPPIKRLGVVSATFGAPSDQPNRFLSNPGLPLQEDGGPGLAHEETTVGVTKPLLEGICKRYMNRAASRGAE